jgi:hypothetical protein
MGKHIKTKRKQLNLKAKQMNWLLGRRSTLSTESKLLLYKALLKLIWTYGGQPPIPTSKSSSAFNPRVNAPWYINNHRIHEDLQINTVLSEI